MSDTIATATSTSSVTLLVAKKLRAKSDAKGIHYDKEYAYDIPMIQEMEHYHSTGMSWRRDAIGNWHGPQDLASVQLYCRSQLIGGTFLII